MTDPVTIVVRRRVRPEAKEAFEAWLRGVIGAASAFEGHLGAEVIRPGSSDQDYVLIFRFDSEAHLGAWERSEVRADWLARAEPYTVGAPEVHRVSGLEFWFTLPDHAATRPPPRWKMAVATVAGIYPLILFVAPWLTGRLSGLPPALATLLSAAVMVTLMTWLIMSLIVRVLRPWLFPSG